jgi:tRNA threonylcarbamoyladenosine biosynthesis protein TsaE
MLAQPIAPLPPSTVGANVEPGHLPLGYNLMMEEVTILTDGPQATRELGARVGALLSPGSCVLLKGDLGAGKTTFAQGVARGLGVAEHVVSPTFVLVREYDCPNGSRLIHIDFYRVSGPEEALDLGIDDYLASSDIVVIEWPENARGALPPEHIIVSLELDRSPFGRGERRRISIGAAGDDGERVLHELRSVEE